MPKHRVVRAKDAPAGSPPLASVLISDHKCPMTGKEVKAPSAAVADAIINHAVTDAVRQAVAAGVPVPEFVESVEADGIAETVKASKGGEK